MQKTAKISGFLAVLIVAMLVLPFLVVEVKAEQTTASGTMPSVLFNAMEIGVDANDVVLTVDGVNYTVDAFPLRLSWVNGSTHTFEYAPLDDWSPPFGLAIYDYADPSKPQGPKPGLDPSHPCVSPSQDLGSLYHFT